MADPTPGRGKAARPGAGAARSARRRARSLALQGLYQWLLSGEDAGVIEAHLAEAPEWLLAGEDEDAVHARMAGTTAYERTDREHFAALLHGVIGAIDELRAAIAPNLDRRVEELSPVEHAVLLLGAFELLRHPEIPYRVVINEAVELAKTFGGTDGSFRYVNGVLDRVAARLRPVETAAR